jgi:hypothetical protein
MVINVFLQALSMLLNVIGFLSPNYTGFITAWWNNVPKVKHGISQFRISDRSKSRNSQFFPEAVLVLKGEVADPNQN